MLDLGLLGIATVIAFGLGTLAGALLAWPRSPRALHFLFMPFLTLSAIPYYLLGLVLVYVFAFRLQWLPLFGQIPYDFSSMSFQVTDRFDLVG